ncbi:MAG: PIN domain-containing protein [Eubacterium sp.]|nr:PIN domain-containing protein [Eubacterium sp.]MDE6889322.1 PIN domain-containing protein [Eubacterium sp.]
MVVLVDTNIILDVLLKREPYAGAAQMILTKCAEREITGCLAAHSIPNLFYILRKAYSQQERRRFIRNLCDIFRVSDLNAEKIMRAAENEEFTDFEDCLQEECAAAEMADYIVTRNPDDYKKSRIKVLEPDEFLKLL